MAKSKHAAAPAPRRTGTGFLTLRPPRGGKGDLYFCLCVTNPLAFRERLRVRRGAQERRTSMSRTTMLRAIAAGTAFASLLAGPVAGRDNNLKLPACGKSHDPVSLQIVTDAHIGWKVNGLNAQAESNAAWFPIPPSNWIGRHQHQAGNFSFVIHFSALHPHGAMS